MSGWCDECGHEIGVSDGNRLGYETEDERIICGKCKYD